MCLRLSPSFTASRLYIPLRLHVSIDPLSRRPVTLEPYRAISPVSPCGTIKGECFAGRSTFDARSLLTVIRPTHRADSHLRVPLHDIDTYMIHKSRRFSEAKSLVGGDLGVACEIASKEALHVWLNIPSQCSHDGLNTLYRDDIVSSNRTAICEYNKAWLVARILRLYASFPLFTRLH